LQANGINDNIKPASLPFGGHPNPQPAFLFAGAQG